MYLPCAALIISPPHAPRLPLPPGESRQAAVKKGEVHSLSRYMGMTVDRFGGPVGIFYFSCSFAASAVTCLLFPAFRLGLTPYPMHCAAHLAPPKTRPSTAPLMPGA